MKVSILKVINFFCSFLHISEYFWNSGCVDESKPYHTSTLRNLMSILLIFSCIKMLVNLSGFFYLMPQST